MSFAAKRVLPGFNITLGYTLVYLSLLVLIPLSATFIKSATLTLDRSWASAVKQTLQKRRKASQP